MRKTSENSWKRKKKRAVECPANKDVCKTGNYKDDALVIFITFSSWVPVGFDLLPGLCMAAVVCGVIFCNLSLTDKNNK